MSATLAIASETFRFAWPAAFLLLPLPWLIGRIRGHAGAGGQGAIRLPQARGLPSATGPTGRAGPHSILFWITLVALVLAVARPQWLIDQARPAAGRDLLLVLDVSASMQARDLRSGQGALTRLEAAAGMGRRFLGRRAGDRAGLVVFGSRPYLHTPLTYDLPSVGRALDAAAVGLAGAETALGDAVGLAVRTLAGEPAAIGEGAGRDTAAPGRVAILVSDGASNRGALSPQQAAWLASRSGVRIHALGIGAEPDEASLRQLAGQSGGHYARATDAAAVADFYARIDALEAVTRPTPGEPPAGAWKDLHAVPLALAALLVAWSLVVGRLRSAAGNGPADRVGIRRPGRSASASAVPATRAAGKGGA